MYRQNWITECAPSHTSGLLPLLKIWNVSLFNTCSNNYDIKVSLELLEYGHSSWVWSYYERKKRKRAVFVFSLPIRWIRKIKDVLSWQLERTIWQDLTKPITKRRTSNRIKTCRRWRRDANTPPQALSLSLHARLSASIPDCLSICLPFTLPALQSGIYPASAATVVNSSSHVAN